MNSIFAGLKIRNVHENHRPGISAPDFLPGPANSFYIPETRYIKYHHRCYRMFDDNTKQGRKNDG